MARARDVLLLWIALTSIGAGVVSRWWWFVAVGVALLLLMVVLIARESRS